jgi:hypothetical protein
MYVYMFVSEVIDRESIMIDHCFQYDDLSYSNRSFD